MVPAPPAKTDDPTTCLQVYNLDLTTKGYILEAWSLGWLFCGLIIMILVTIANMQPRLLHRLILLELVLGLWRPLAIFMGFAGWGWYHGSSSMLLYISYTVHSFIAWLKVKPFLSRRGNMIFFGLIVLVCPYWVLEAYSNYTYFTGINTVFKTTRLLEAPFRDPFWLFSCLNLLYNIRKRYYFGYIQLVRTAPRFGIMLLAMALSLVFSILDIVFSVNPLDGMTGVNPFWKVSMVFKCFSDTIILDDFKSALEKIRRLSFENSRQQDYYIGSGTGAQPTRPDDPTDIKLTAVSTVSAVTFEPDRHSPTKSDTIYITKTVDLEEGGRSP